VTEGFTPSGQAFAEIHLPVADWTELLGKVLSFGASAEALSPPRFRQEWKVSIKAMAELAGKA
jgi:predicted DNA-binding transcriptional regulator YafY